MKHTIKKKYRDDPEKLAADLEEIMAHYGRLSMKTEGSENFRHYCDGSADGLNKAYKLLFVSGESVEGLKA